MSSGPARPSAFGLVAGAILFALSSGCERERQASAASLSPAPTATPTARASAAARTVSPTSALSPAPGQSVVRFATIGDYGVSSRAEMDVADLVHVEAPDFVITLGDNNYPSGAAHTIDKNVGRFYQDFIHPYRGAFGKGASENRFFPSLGNHDWYTDGASAYLAYFTLPGNERYYDFVRGDVHFFAIDSDRHEPDGIDRDSKQAEWLKQGLRDSKSPWQLVYFHHPAYSSGRHGSEPALQWPFDAWGADMVLAGHDHHYERLVVKGVTYVINGLGGAPQYPVGAPLPGSEFRYNEKHGAQIIEATANRLVARFINVDRQVVDQFTLERPAAK